MDLAIPVGTIFILATSIFLYLHRISSCDLTQPPSFWSWLGHAETSKSPKISCRLENKLITAKLKYYLPFLYQISHCPVKENTT